MIDKSKALQASVSLVNDRLHFIANVEGNSPISIDYTPPLGDNLGYTSLELLLLSLASCMGSAVLTFLRRMNKTILKCDIQAHGLRREEHPLGFKSILVEFTISSPDLNEDDFTKVLKLAEEKYCPVLAMIRGNTEVTTSCKIIR